MITDASAAPAAKPKKPFYKRAWFIILAVVVAIGVIANLAGGGDKNTATPPADTSKPAPESKSVSEPPSQPQSKPAEAPEPATRDNSGAKPVTLGAGAHSSPAHVAPGRYVITPEGGTGNLLIKTESDPLYVNEILGSPETIGVPSVTVDVPDGAQIELKGVKAKFTPAETKSSTELTTGRWVVGIDIPVGRYVATPAAGQTGNLIVNDASGWPSVSEILGGEYGVETVTADLTDGQSVHIAGLASVSFAPA